MLRVQNLPDFRGSVFTAPRFFGKMALGSLTVAAKTDPAFTCAGRTFDTVISSASHWAEKVSAPRSPSLFHHFVPSDSASKDVLLNAAASTVPDSGPTSLNLLSVSLSSVTVTAPVDERYLGVRSNGTFLVASLAATTSFFLRFVGGSSPFSFPFSAIAAPF